MNKSKKMTAVAEEKARIMVTNTEDAEKGVTPLPCVDDDLDNAARAAGGIRTVQRSETNK